MGKTTSKFTILIPIFSIASVVLSAISIFELNQELIKAKISTLNTSIENYSLIGAIYLLLTLIVVVISVCATHKAMKIIGMIVTVSWFAFDIFVIFFTIVRKNSVIESYNFVFTSNYKEKATEIQNANKCCGWTNIGESMTNCTYTITCKEAFQKIGNKSIIILVIMFTISLGLNGFNIYAMGMLMMESLQKPNDYVQITQAQNVKLSYL